MTTRNALADLLATFEMTEKEQRKLAVWAKGHIIPGYDSAIWRRDDYGRTIRYSDHGDRNSSHGWEQDHHPVPAALGGRDDVANLRPLHCINNASLGGLLGALLKG